MEDKKIIWANWNTIDECKGGQETFGDMLSQIFNAKQISYNSCENTIQTNLFVNLHTKPPVYQGYVIENYLKRYEELFDLDLIIKNSGVGGYENFKTPHIIVFQDPFYSIQKMFMDRGMFFENFWKYNASVDLQRKTAEQGKTVAVSNFMKNEMEANKIKCDKVIEEGVDIEEFNPVEDKITLRRMHQLPTDKKIGIIVTKFVQQKGWDLLTKLINKFQDIHWIVVLTEKIGSKPKLKNVTLIEEASHKLMPRLYNCSDFYVSTSPVESFNLSAIEAMSCDIPIIVFKTGFAWDWWDEKTGLRVDEWNYKSFEEAIENLFKKSYEPRNILIKKGFTKERMEREWKEFIDSIVNKKQ